MKETMETTLSMKWLACFKLNFGVVHIMKFIMHISSSIDVDARCNESHYDKHQNSDRVDVPADRQPKCPTCIECVPVSGVRDWCTDFSMTTCITHCITVSGRSIRRRPDTRRLPSVMRLDRGVVFVMMLRPNWVASQCPGNQSNQGQQG